MIREADSKELELFHYGVKGMRWGVRRKTDSDGLAVGSPPGRKAARAEKKANKERLKNLDRESKARDKAASKSANAETVKKIEAARKRMESGEAAAEWKAAKQQYKIDKQTIGKREARKALYKAQDKYDEEWTTAQTVKNGKELITYSVISAYTGIPVELLPKR